jgi:hypothetical protein
MNRRPQRASTAARCDRRRLRGSERRDRRGSGMAVTSTSSLPAASGPSRRTWPGAPAASS